MAPEALPTEVWLRVASFIPDHHLNSLGAVSRLFYGIQTDRRYRRLLLDDDRPARLEGKLRRLRNSSDVRHLVQSIAVHPRAIRSACLRSGRDQKKNVGTRSPRNPPSAFRAEVTSLTFGEDLDLADLFLDGLSDLPNCGELHVEWERPSTAEESFCIPLLKALMLSIGPQLTTLSLSMAFDVLSSFVKSIHDLPLLESLEFNLGLNMVDPEGMEEAEKHQEALARFINRLSPTLRRLSITCLSHFRLCTLFDHLFALPQLKGLRLHLPFDQYHLDDAVGLNQFLRAHTAIAHLSLTPVHCCNRYHSLWKSVTTQWPDADSWLHHVFAGLEFHDLRTLELGLNTTGGAPRVLPSTAYMGNVTNNVGCLTILGVIMSVGDLDSILRPFAANGKHSPKKVVLEVHVLSREILDTLSRASPELESLHLMYRWSVTAGTNDTATFVESMKAHRYDEWKIRIFILTCVEVRHSRCREAQQCIIKSVPYVTP